MDYFGLSYTCTEASECLNHNVYCVDLLSTGGVCEVRCEGSTSCSGVDIVVANSGGLRLHCSGHTACKRTSVQWVNSANLAVYQGIHADAALGGALHLVECTSNNFACEKLNVKGDTQELDLDTVSVFNCGGGVPHVLSCASVSAIYVGSVQVNCIAQSGCRGFRLTCLSGANCETTSLNAEKANDAIMYCEPDAASCVCHEYWTCVTLGLTTTHLPTTTLLTTTKMPSTTTTATPTTTTKTPTSTTKEPTTTKMHTTTTKTPTTTTKTPTPSTETPTTTTPKASSSTTKPETSTSQMPVTTNTILNHLSSTKITETTEGNSKATGAGIDWLTYGAVIGGLGALLFCFGALFFIWWRTKRAPKRKVSVAPIIRIGVLSVSADATVPEYDCGQSEEIEMVDVRLDKCQPSTGNPLASDCMSKVKAMPDAASVNHLMWEHTHGADTHGHSGAESTDSEEMMPATRRGTRGEGVPVHETVAVSTVGEGHGGEQRADAGILEQNVAQLKRTFIQMKIDARSAEEKYLVQNLSLALGIDSKGMAEEFYALLQMGVDSARVLELLLEKAENILREKGIEPMHKGDAGDEQREVSEEMYDAGPAVDARMETVIGPENLEALIAKTQLAAHSSDEKAAARKLRMALTLAPFKMEEEFRALLQMGATVDEVVLIITDTAEDILRAKHVDF